MSYFNIGDKVFCVDNYNMEDILSFDKFYHVINTLNDSLYTVIQCNDGIVRTLFARRFKLASKDQLKEKIMTKDCQKSDHTYSFTKTGANPINYSKIQEDLSTNNPIAFITYYDDIGEKSIQCIVHSSIAIKAQQYGKILPNGTTIWSSCKATLKSTNKLSERDFKKIIEDVRFLRSLPWNDKSKVTVVIPQV